MSKLLSMLIAAAAALALSGTVSAADQQSRDNQTQAQPNSPQNKTAYPYWVGRSRLLKTSYFFLLLVLVFLALAFFAIYPPWVLIGAELRRT